MNDVCLGCKKELLMGELVDKLSDGSGYVCHNGQCICWVVFDREVMVAANTVTYWSPTARRLTFKPIGRAHRAFHRICTWINQRADVRAQCWFCEEQL